MDKRSYDFINYGSHLKKVYTICELIKIISITTKVVQSLEYLLEIKRFLLVRIMTEPAMNRYFLQRICSK
jgi:hypothetical protein